MKENFTRNVQIRRLRGRGLGPHEIARQLKLTIGVVIGVLYRANLCDPSSRGASPAFKSIVCEAATKTSPKAAAEAWNVSLTTVNNWLNEPSKGTQP